MSQAGIDKTLRDCLAYLEGQHQSQIVPNAALAEFIVSVRAAIAENTPYERGWNARWRQVVVQFEISAPRRESPTLV